ncbi:hypothetical protein ACH5RR_039674 [Cinchona calisaya]|uniref:Uncharacterized protein n=1 Tax=Cinchona calisaya TaxID=153742 RepID=A0ABD2Y0M9_9GENT
MWHLEEGLQIGANFVEICYDKLTGHENVLLFSIDIVDSQSVKELPRILSLDKSSVSEMVKKTSTKLLNAFVDLAFQFVDQELIPSQGNFAPVEEIGGRVAVATIEGKIPHNFPEGVYIRNGSNPHFGARKIAKSIFGKSSDIWVEGEGMLHALYFSKDTNGTWNISYNNRYVETETLKLEKERNKPAFLPATEGDSLAVLSAILLNTWRFGVPNKILSNTNIFEHSGKYYTISENHMPQEVDISTLETLGDWELTKSWNRNFTSHPKRTPYSGELVIVGVDGQKPYFEVGVLSADGKKIKTRVDLNYSRCTICHEIGVTEKYNVITDFPLVVDINRLFKGGSLIKFEKEQFARIGVMPRYGDANSIRWFDVTACSVFHLFNSYEDDDEVVVRGCQARGSVIPGPELGLNKFEWFSKGFKQIKSADDTSNEDSEEGILFARAYEWRLSMKTGQVKEKYLTGNEFAMDMPFINETYTGLKSKYGYTHVVDSIASSNAGIVKYGGLAKLYFDEIDCENFALVGAFEEDDGWIISFIHDEDTNKSEAYIIDAKKFSRKPVARITLPSRVPYGFHGTFASTNSDKKRNLMC